MLQTGKMRFFMRKMGGKGAGKSVITELESALIKDGGGAAAAAQIVALPAVSVVTEQGFSRQALHDAKLHDMQAVIVGAGDHLQVGAGVLVEGPEAEVVALEIRHQSVHGAEENATGDFCPGSEEEIVDAPNRPHEPIQDVRGRGDDVLLKPQSTKLIEIAHPALLERVHESVESARGCIEV